jgi:hypothetical protein
MNEMVNLIPTCIVSNKKKYSRMILLNSEKQCIYMYRGRRGRWRRLAGRRMKSRRAGREEQDEENGGKEGGDGGGG